MSPPLCEGFPLCCMHNFWLVFFFFCVLLITLLTSLKTFGFLFGTKVGKRKRVPIHELAWCKMADRITYRS